MGDYKRLYRLPRMAVRRDKRRIERGDRNMMRRAPLIAKAKAAKVDRESTERHKEILERKGRQVTPAAFTAFLQNVHQQARFEPIPTPCFDVN